MADDRGRRLVVTLHGIRTFGQWQERLETLLLEAQDSDAASIEVRHFKYGYFSVFAFLFPPLRWLVTRRFRHYLLQRIRSERWNRVDIVAHSFGTHIASWALYSLRDERDVRIHTVLLAGSVLRSTFPWPVLLGSTIRRVANECGTRDNILLLSQVFVLFTGMAGRAGFVGMVGRDIRNRFYEIGHSGYFVDAVGTPDSGFMKRQWVPLLTSEEPLNAPDDPRSASAMSGIAAFLMNNADPIKVALWATPIVLFVLWLMAQRDTLSSQVLANHAIYRLDRQHDVALLLAAGAQHIKPTPEARRALISALHHRANLRKYLYAPSQVTSIAADQAFIRAAVGGDDGSVSVFDIASGRQLTSFRPSASPIKTLDLSPDGKWVVFADYVGTVAVHDATSGERRWMTQRKGQQYAVAFAPDSITIAIAAGDDVSLHDVSKPAPTALPQIVGGAALMVGVSPDMHYLAVAGDRGLVLWRLEEGPSLKRLDTTVPETISFAFREDSKALLLGTRNGEIAELDLYTRRLSRRASALNEQVWSVGYGPDNGTVLGRVWSQVNAWTDKRDTPVAEYRGIAGDGRGGLALNRRTGLLLSSSGTNLAMVWYAGDLSRHDERQTKNRPGIRGLLVDERDSTITSAHYDGGLERRRADGKLVVRYAGPDLSGDSVDKVSLSKSGLLAFATAHGKIILRDSRDGAVLLTEPAYDNDVRAVAIDRSGKALATIGCKKAFGCNDPALTLWRINRVDGTDRGARLIPQLSIGVPDASSRALALSQNSELFAYATDGHIVVASTTAENGREVHLRAPTVPKTLAMSDDGKLVAASTGRGEILLWHVEKPETHRSLSAHTRDIRTMVFSPDSTLLASLDDQETVVLWDLASGMEISDRLLRGRNYVQALAFSGDGKRLVLGDWSGSVAVLNFNDADMRRFACRIANRKLTADEIDRYGSGRSALGDFCSVESDTASWPEIRFNLGEDAASAPVVRMVERHHP